MEPKWQAYLREHAPELYDSMIKDLNMRGQAYKVRGQAYRVLEEEYKCLQQAANSVCEYFVGLPEGALIDPTMLNRVSLLRSVVEGWEVKR
jgi:hypothetical protein